MRISVVECVSVILQINNEPVQLVSLYRPPKIKKVNRLAQFLNKLLSFLQSLSKTIKIVLCGDININLLNKQNKYVTEYESLMAEFGFTKCIGQVTRREILNGNLVESCLDHIYVRVPLATIKSAVIQQKISDHYFVSVALRWKYELPDMIVQNAFNSNSVIL